MQSHFFIILIFLRSGTQSGVVQLRRRAPALPPGSSFHSSISAFTISLHILLPCKCFLCICITCLSTWPSPAFFLPPASVTLCGCFHSHSLVHLALLFFRRRPRSQAAGLYLVRPMIKSAGLTSASDRPIHPTDTPPLPHGGEAE